MNGYSRISDVFISVRGPWFDLQCQQEQEMITDVQLECVWVANTAASAVSTGN
jgi:hypothetical protein